jgi:phage nucleotide-binding protein
MAIKIRTLKDAAEGNGVKVLVYGPAGVGKTVLCATAKMKTLMLSAEAGLLSIKDAPHDMIEVIEVKSINDLEEAYNYVRANLSKYELIALDSISEIAEVLLSEEKARTKDPRQAYGVLQDETTKILRRFRDLPLNVIMVAKQTRMTDDFTGITNFMPAMPGKALPQQVGYLFDEVFALRVVKNDEGEEVRVLQTNRDITYEAKDRSGLLNQFEPANLAHVFSKIGVKTNA